MRQCYASAYAMGEEMISRKIIENVADNLDLLPDKKLFISNAKIPEEMFIPARVLTSEAEEEIWGDQ